MASLLSTVRPLGCTRANEARHDCAARRRAARFARQNNISVGDDFLEYIASCDEDLSARWGKKWVDVAENEAASPEIYARLATYGL